MPLKFRKIRSRQANSNEDEKETKKNSESGKMSHSLRSHSRLKKEPVETASNMSYTCPICRKTYKDVILFSVDLYSHLNVDKSSDDWDPNVCKVCETQCIVPEQLSSHLLSHLDAKKFKENIKSTVKKKERIENEPGNSTCSICGKKISKKYNLKRHMATHTGEKKYICHHCGKQYAQDSGLQRHLMVIHEGVRKYKCPICSLVLGSNSELKSHQDTHTDPKPFQCDQCGKTFNRQKHLYYHRKYHHTKNGMREQCKDCKRYFSSPSVMRRHYKVIHMGLKEFQCHVCSAQLTTKSYLQEHLRIHSDERPEVCTFCGKTFQLSGNLRQHLKTHMERNYVCDVCGKRFTRRGHLIIHMGSHKGLEQPRCAQCGKIFVLKGDLEEHVGKEHQLPLNFTSSS